MKPYIAFLFLLALVGCGNDKKSKSQVQKEEDETEILTSCEDLKSLKCTLPTQYVIVSNQKLPKKLKVYFKNDKKRSLIFNQCNPRSIYQLFPSEGVATLGFREPSDLFEQGMSLEIVDVGEDCNNDAVFFDEVLAPSNSDSWVNARVTKTFNLNN